MSEKLTVRSIYRDYDLYFIDDVSGLLRSERVRKDRFWVIDARLADLYKDKFSEILTTDHVITIEATENNKTIDYCQQLIKKLVEKNIRKNSVLVAIGGGILQDITAFIASVLFRGIEWEFFPTTLLAQADSCIGSKTSVNLGQYKNLLGSFCPPSNIYIDVGFLETLPRGEIKSGIGEILHFYLISDSILLEEMMNAYDELVASPRRLKPYIVESLRIKKRVIEVDEFDKHDRNLFNYGHTFGHAIETVSDYRINHGQAVTMGMDIANYVSLRLGNLDEADFFYMHRILEQNMPIFKLEAENMDNYFLALSKDKKNTGDNLVCILTTGPGSMRKAVLALDEKLRNIIAEYFKFPIVERV